jgi:predicted O-linked N-acetylglucosamine transferase (SPINDLY family)
VATIAEALAAALWYFRAGHLQMAEETYRSILAVAPAHAEAQCNLGVVLARQGRLEEAVACHQAALRANPDHAEAYYNLGNTLRRLGRLPEAVAAYQATLSRRPEQGSCHYNLALALAELGRIDEAVEHIQKTLETEPNFAEAYNTLGNLLRVRGRLDEATATFEQFVRLRPDDPRGHYNRGLVLTSQRRPAEAEASFREALRLQPGYAEAHSGLGIVLKDKGREDEAFACFQQAVRQKPTLVDAHNNLGGSYTEQGSIAEALACYRKVVELQPQQPALYSNLVFTLNYDPALEPEAVFAEHRRWAERFADKVPPLPARAPVPAAGRRLRVGYVSADFRTHTMAALIEPILAHHDRERFHVFCYANVHWPDEVTDRLRPRSETWRDIASVDDDEAARLVRADEIDVLVDLGGHTGSNRLLLFARKSAPVQVTGFGYLNTTGMTAMGYRISDPFADPQGMTEKYHTEELVRLPEIAWCYQPWDESPDVAPLSAKAPGDVTFASFNNLAKVNVHVIALWARVLAALPGARLLLLRARDEHGVRRVDAEFARHGVAPGRVTWMTRRPRREYLELYHQVDVGLDPFPYNGCVTTCDALWMGVPVISLAGSMSVGRQGVSLLSNVGLAELVASDGDDYVRIAQSVAGDLGRLRGLRAELRDRTRASPLVDAGRFTRHLEDAYLRLYERCATGQKP